MRNIAEIKEQRFLTFSIILGRSTIGEIGLQR